MKFMLEDAVDIWTIYQDFSLISFCISEYDSEQLDHCVQDV